MTAERVLFVCTHNAARSQLAAALWRHRGQRVMSAGTRPARRVHAYDLIAERIERLAVDVTT